MLFHFNVPWLWRMCALMLLALPIGAAAQNSITVTTSVNPPYSPYLADYVGFDNKIVVTLINTKAETFNVRLVGAFIGENGITIEVPQDFKPPNPIILGPNQVRVLSGNQLKDYVNPDNLDFSGISKQEVVQGNGLPEGNYRFCMRAFDYNSNQALSLPEPSGCANFKITHFNPPQLLQPQCNGTVNANNPQNVVFTWTIPAGAPPHKVEYLLKIVEMFPQNVNPNQAMLAATDPPFFETVVNSTSFLFGPNAPTLEDGKKYAVRVTARNKGNSKELHFKNDGHSAVCSFTYVVPNNNQQQEDDDQQDEEQNDDQDNDQVVDLEEDYENPCASLNCAPQPIATGPAGNITYKVGDEVKIGYFIMKISSLSSAGAANLSGEGTIDAPIFKTQLKATFQGLKVNAQHKVFAGEVIGAYSPGASVDNALKNFQDNLGNIGAQKVKNVTDYVKANQKYVEDFVDLDAQGLPFAWKKIVSGKTQLLNIASVKFEPDGARFNAFLNFTIPEANNKIVAFGQKNICFHPTGLSVDGLQKLTMLGNDVDFKWGQNITVVLKAADNNNNGTFVRWDCEGYKDMQLDGEFRFANALIEKTEGNGPVKASFTFNAGAWGDMLGEVSMDAFSIKGLQGLKLDFNQVVLDFSDTRNPQGMAFPNNYNGGQGNDWRGFYFKKITVTLPDYLKKNNQEVSITLKDALINKLGFTGAMVVQPVVNIDKGDLGGWAFSMDKIEIALLNNSLTKGEFLGKIKLPVAETKLGYKCLLSQSNQGLQTAFEISTLDDLEVNMWAATLQLFNGSSISIEAVQSDVTVEAKLSGKLTIDKSFPDMKNVSVKIPNVEFQNFKIKNKKPYISFQSFKFASPQKVFAGFPVSIKPELGDGIEIKTDNPDNVSKIGIKLGFHIGLDGNGTSAISGGTAFTVWAKRGTDNNGRQKWSFDKTQLNKVSVKAEVAVVKIEGEIEIFNGDPDYGDGFRGRLSATFKSVVEIYATAQFGSKPKKNNPNERFRYWYVDAMVKINAGIPVYPTFGFYGFGGGAWYHMTMVDNSLPKHSSLAGNNNINDPNYNVDDAGATASGVQFVPDEDVAFGLKATILMGLYPAAAAEVFNGDITLQAEFFTKQAGGGLKYVRFTGNGYFVSATDDRSSSVLTATADFYYQTNPQMFHGSLTVDFKVGKEENPIIHGTGQAVIHFEKMNNNQTKWYISVGTPSNRIQLKIWKLITVDSYFMVGSHIPGPPPLPAPFNSQPELGDFPLSRGPQAQLGQGFAFGQGFEFDTGDLKFLIFYASIEIDLGFDVTVRKLNQTCPQAEDGGLMGIRGWYAEGQAYAGLDARIGIDIDVWFFKTRYEIFGAYVYGALAAGLPNPSWFRGFITGGYTLFNGLVSGSFTYHVEAGQYCDPNGGDPFMGLEVISDMKPTGTGVDVFKYPQVAFNFPIGSTVELVEVKKKLFSQKAVIHKFRFHIKDFWVKEKVGNSYTKTLVGEYVLREQNKMAVFNNEFMFEPHKWHKANIRIYGEKQKMVDDVATGEWVVVRKHNSNQIHYEEDFRTFKTGGGPKKFHNSFTSYTYPFRYQRYMYPKEAKNGVWAFIKGIKGIFDAKPKNNAYKYVFKAKFNKVDAGSVTVAETNMTYEKVDGVWMARFNIPQNLDNETIYQVQLIMRMVKKPQGWLQMAPQGQSSALKTTTETIDLDKDNPDENIMKKKRTRINQSVLGDNEHLLGKIFFKTSAYDKFVDKYTKYAKSSPGGNIYGKKGQGGLGKLTLYCKLKGDEPFDYYDFRPLKVKQDVTWEYKLPPVYALAWIKDSYFNAAGSWSYQYAYHLSYVEYFDYWTWTYRDYPAKFAYQPGSIYLQDLTIEEYPVPFYGVGLKYQGTGAHHKLTSNEINKAFWKKLPPDIKLNAILLNPNKGNNEKGPNKKSLPSKKGSGKLNLKLINVKGFNMGGNKPKPKPKPKPAGQNQANMNMNLQQELHNFLQIRYDLYRIMYEDRLKLSGYINKTWGGNTEANGKRDSYLEKIANGPVPLDKGSIYPIKIYGYRLPPGAVSNTNNSPWSWYLRVSTNP